MHAMRDKREAFPVERLSKDAPRRAEGIFAILSLKKQTTQEKA